MSESDIAIVIAAYNRPESLNRLLSSISSAIYPEDLRLDLIISIDYSGFRQCHDIAESFNWAHGSKLIIDHESNLGLKAHILKCGDLVSEYEFIILLEDDLFVSQYYIDYSIRVYQYYQDDSKIAGFSLYSYHFNETAQKYFISVNDGCDVYFLQLPSSWGQIWTKRQWSNFKAWLDNHYSSGLIDHYLIPQNVIGWPDTSWKKLFIIYMVVNDLYFVYPRTSLSTNFMDVGVHHLVKESFLQVELQTDPIDYRFKSYFDAEYIYDSFCEVSPKVIRNKVPELESFDFEVDLYGTKPVDKIRKRYVLSSQISCNYLYQYPLSLKPHELNIIYKLCGEGIYFSRTQTILSNKYKLTTLERNSYYFNIPKYLINTNKHLQDDNNQSNGKHQHLYKRYWYKDSLAWKLARAAKNRIVGYLRS